MQRKDKDRHFKKQHEWVMISAIALALVLFVPLNYFLLGSSGSEDYLNRSIRSSHFEWLGTLGNGRNARQFTSSEIVALATKSKYYVMPKFHAGYIKKNQHVDAAAIKRRLPDIDVLFYISGRYIFILEQAFFAELGFDESWYLKGEIPPYTNAKVPQSEADWCLAAPPSCAPPTGNNKCELNCNFSNDACVPCDPNKPQTKYMDMSNPFLRAWLIEYMRSHFAEKYDGTNPTYIGIAFDSARRIAETDSQRAYWETVLTPEKIDAWNAGLETLLAEARSTFPSAFIAFNGVGKVAQTPDRGEGFLNAYADSALNEWFCLKPVGSAGAVDYMTPDELQEELTLVEKYGKTGKVLLLHVDYNEPHHAAALGKNFNDIARYCFGAFSLVNRTGRSYFKIGEYAVTPESFRYPKEAIIRLGAPKGDSVMRKGSVFFREFQNGYVYVNAGAESVTITLPNVWLVLANGGVLGTKYAPSALYELKSHDAAFFLRTEPAPNAFRPPQ